MGVNIKVSGDPRRPNECHKFKQLPPAAEDQTPAALLIFSTCFGLASLLLKIKAFGWAGMVCVLVSLANVNSADMEAKSYLSSFGFSLFGIGLTYFMPPAYSKRS